MGRGTSGVKGMNVSQKGNRVLALNVARDDAELLVVTENGYGKRTALSEYPVKNRGTKGVLTARLTETKGGLAGALIVREHQDLMFITENGMVQRTSVEGIRKTGRPTQGVKVMNVREGDHISAVALVVESDAADVNIAEAGASSQEPLPEDGSDGDAPATGADNVQAGEGTPADVEAGSAEAGGDAAGGGEDQTG
jgi:DNA gyrase subunit A